jgi:gamma-glutamylputrescine oxidase
MGGAAGCSAALHVGRSGKSCVLLESRGVSWGATGHNGGHLWPAQSDERSRRAFEARSTAQLKAFLDASGANCDVEFPGSVELACSAGEMQLIRSGAGEEWSAERVTREFHAAEGRFAGGMFHAAGGRVDPVAATRAIAHAAEEAGVAIHTGTEVVALEEVASEAGGAPRVRVVTRGRRALLAHAVLVCTNAWAGELLPELRGAVQPVLNHVVATAPLEQRLWQLGFTAEDDCYYGLQRADGRVIFGGWAGDQPGAAGLRDPALRRAGEEAVRRYLRGAFPALEDVPFEREWTGVIAETPDGLPLLGALPLRAGVWVCAAFNGHGMPVCFACGQEAAALALAGALRAGPRPAPPRSPAHARPARAGMERGAGRGGGSGLQCTRAQDAFCCPTRRLRAFMRGTQDVL